MKSDKSRLSLNLKKIETQWFFSKGKTAENVKANISLIITCTGYNLYSFYSVQL